MRFALFKKMRGERWMEMAQEVLTLQFQIYFNFDFLFTLCAGYFRTFISFFSGVYLRPN